MRLTMRFMIALNNSLSLSLNATCSAAFADEAAVAYSIDLSTGDQAKTDSAITSARGDWSALGTLPNATLLRDITRQTEQVEHRIVINLLGIYNAESVDQFVKTCTILHDADGQVLITDKATASHVAVASAPFLADSQKLRSALSEAFLATVTYVAGSSAGDAHVRGLHRHANLFPLPEQDVPRRHAPTSRAGRGPAADRAAELGIRLLSPIPSSAMPESASPRPTMLRLR